MSTPKVSFTIRRPTPVSRASSEAESDSSFKVPHLPRHLVNDSSAPGSPLARSTTSSPRPSAGYADDDSSGEDDDEAQDELVTGFDKFGVQRANKPKKKPQGPLVIPALQNRDWKELARKRRSAHQYVPAGMRAQIGADGSVGGLGTRDSINSGPTLAGLQVRKREVKDEDETMKEEDQVEEVKMEVEETDDQKALRAILAAAGGEEEGPTIDIIPTPISEADAYKQDVDELPDSATLDDYNRIPVSQFGAAILRGMGWKEGTAATRKPGKGMVEPYLPESRPALLGIGAKEREALDDGSKSKRSNRPERRYVPVVKRDRDGNIVSETVDRDRRRKRSKSPRRSGSAPTSRGQSRSPSRHHDSDDRRREVSRRERDHHSSDRDSDRRKDGRRDGYRSRDSEQKRRDY